MRGRIGHFVLSHSHSLSRLRYTPLAIALTFSVSAGGCRAGAPSASSGSVETHPVVVRLLSDDCPMVFLRLRVAPDADERSVVDADSDALGVVNVQVGRGTYRARLTACGRVGSFTFDARTPVTSYSLPPRTDDPALPHAPWAARPAAERRRCQFPTSSGTERLLAGEYTSLRLDERTCALHLNADGATWLYGSARLDGKPVRLGTTAPFDGEQIVIAYDAKAVVSVERATGARTVVAPEARAVALSPHTDVLLFSRDFDLMGRHMSLDARWPDGRTRHLSDRAHTHTAFSEDGHWLAFLDTSDGDACPTMHVVDLVRAEDRAELRVCRAPAMLEWGLPHFVSARHVLVVGNDGHLVVDASNGQTVKQLRYETTVEPFEHGIVVQAQEPGTASLWNFSTGATFSLPFRFDHVHPLPSGDLLLLRGRKDERFDVIFVDPTNGRARTVVEGVSGHVAASKDGLLVFEEENRFLALPIGSTHVSAFPRKGEAVESFSGDGRWVGLRGPVHKATPMWHRIAPVDGRRETDEESSERGQWAHDGAAFIYLEHAMGSRVASLRVRFTDRGQTSTLATEVESFVVLDGGQIVYAKHGDGVHATTLAVPGTAAP